MELQARDIEISKLSRCVSQVSSEIDNLREKVTLIEH